MIKATPHNGDPAITVDTETQSVTDGVMARLGYGYRDYSLSEAEAGSARIDRRKLREANGWTAAFADGYAAGTEDGLARRVVRSRWRRTDDYGSGYRSAIHEREARRAAGADAEASRMVEEAAWRARADYERLLEGDGDGEA